MPSNATETIDARILRLIGLEDTFDLDYDTYITLLKEAAVKGRMPKTEIPTEEIELLTDELKRVKSKKDKGRFKVKKKKITSTALKTGGIAGKKTSIPASKLLPAAQTQTGDGDAAGGFNLSESFAKIAEAFTSIVNSLKEKNKLSKKEGAFDRKAEENERRKLQKENLKKRFSKMASVAQKIMQPVQSLLDKLINYFVMIFLGRVVIKLIDWFSNKENQGKIKTIVRFIGDWWPALLGGFLLFGTGLGGLIATFVPTIVGWSAKLLGVIGGSALLKTALAATGLFTAGAWLPKLIPGLVDEDVKPGGPGDHSWGGYEDQQRRTTDQAQKGGPGDHSWGGYENKKLQGLNNGGWIVPGSGSGDTVPAMLTPGESVLQVGARERLIEETGVDPLSANIGPNANKPQIMGGTMFASRGGIVGRGTGAGSPAKGYKVPQRNYSSGSLISDPLGALDRILGKSSGGKFRLPSGGGQDTKPKPSSSPPPPKPQPRVEPKDSIIPPSSKKQETSADQEAGGIPERMLKSPTFRDSGLLYLRSMLGGLGGPITESQLSRESNVELNNAIARAKLRVGSELALAEKKLAEAKAGGFNKQVLAERQSVRDRLKRGEIRVLYQDYYDGNDEKNITPAAENAKSILGQFWATSTEKGGYRVVNEKYDFVEMPDPMAVLRGDSSGVSKNAISGQPITLRQKLQALHQLNPFAREMTVDMILGEKPNPMRDMGNIMKYTMGGMADHLTGNLFDFDKQGGGLAGMMGGGKEDKARQKVDKQLSTLQGMSKQQVLNAQKYAASRGKYFSSTDGKTYKSYQDALDAQKEKSKAQISPQQKPKTAPPPPHTSVVDPTFGHEITTWGSTEGTESSSNPSPATPSTPNIPIIGGWLDKLAVLGIGG